MQLHIIWTKLIKEKFATELKNPYKWKESKKKRKKGVTLFNIKKKRETKCKNIMLCKNKNAYL